VHPAKALKTQFADDVILEFQGDRNAQFVPYNIIAALQNFLTNSIKFGSKPKLFWSSTEIHTNISIVDRGPGMTPEVFEKFGQPMVSSSGGSGFGIFFSLGLREKDDFKVCAGTEIGRGTKIHISNDHDFKSKIACDLKQQRELV
jgi:signal transduction histidine kinase